MTLRLPIYWIAILLLLAQLPQPLALSAEPVSIGSRLEPFVDGFLIESLKGDAKLVVQKPQPQEVALRADKPWEGNTSAYYTIFQDGDKFRAYYRGSHYDEKTKKGTHREVACYAESTDGIHFTKPELGLFEFDGSKANNIVWDGPGGHCFTPFLDTNPKCPPDAMYKAVTAVKGGLIPLKSADGVRWHKMSDKPVITKGAFDSQNLAFWDPHIGKYREYHRAFRVVRDIMTGTSDDFLSWTDPVWLEYPGIGPTEHLYTNAIRNYPGAPHILIGFPTRFLPKTAQTEPTFMVSRDGQTFQRYTDAVIPESAPEDRRGNRSNYMAWGLLELPNKPNEWSVYAKEAYYAGPASRIRRFTYRRDGLVALSALAADTSSEGEAVTRPLTFTGKTLVLNYRTSRSGSVRVELQDADGKPMAPFTADKCSLSGDELAAKAAWAKQTDVGSLAGKPIRIRFVLKDAELFSMRFK